MRIILAYKLNEKLMAREGFLGVPSSRLASSSFAVVSKRMKKKKKIETSSDSYSNSNFIHRSSAFQNEQGLRHELGLTKRRNTGDRLSSSPWPSFRPVKEICRVVVLIPSTIIPKVSRPYCLCIDQLTFEIFQCTVIKRDILFGVTGNSELEIMPVTNSLRRR